MDKSGRNQSHKDCCAVGNSGDRNGGSYWRCKLDSRRLGGGSCGNFVTIDKYSRIAGSRKVMRCNNADKP